MGTVSDLAELTSAPADTDEFYINDGGTSKKITATNLNVLHRGALITMSADDTGQDIRTARAIDFNQKAYDTEGDATTQRNKIWLGADATFTAEADDDLATLTAHGMITGDGPFRVSNAGGGLPAGLAAATDYWALVASDNTFKFATSLANALAETTIDLTTDGTGTQTLLRQTRLVVPSGITSVKISGAFNIINSSSGWNSINLKKNEASGTTYAGGVFNRSQISAAITMGNCFQTGVLVVVGGDYFTFHLGTQTDSSLDIKANGTWFCMDIIG